MAGRRCNAQHEPTKATNHTKMAGGSRFSAFYMEYGFLEGDVASWNVATLCFVPEPATISLLVLLAGVMLLQRRHV
ncbi:MAG: PEP-CTERM sorting domain-containing protein [Patescibacteria group bacterium]|nr:PEP-CTERM sorting domain-containing protein [Patescibacteria group bacterium]